MSYETIKLEKSEAVAVIRLSRPERMNAVIEQMYRDLQAALEEIRQDDGLRAVILTGSVRVKDGVSKQAFCAGADLKKHEEGARTRGQKRAYIELAHETCRLLREFDRPVIAAVNGPARGAGAEMAFACDFVLMANEASVAFPETGLGTFVGGGVTYHLPRLVGLARAKELIYTGRVVGGESAVEMGLAQESCSIEELMPRCHELAAQLAEKAPLSMELAKKRLQQSSGIDLETTLQLEADAILACMDTEDWAEGIRAFAEKRKPKYEGR